MEDLFKTVGIVILLFMLLVGIIILTVFDGLEMLGGLLIAVPIIIAIVAADDD